MSENFEPEPEDTQEVTSEIAVYESPWGEVRVGKGDDMTLFIEFVRVSDSEESLLPGILWVQIGEGKVDTGIMRDEIEQLVKQKDFQTGRQFQVYLDQHIDELNDAYIINHTVDNMIEGLYSNDGIDD